MTTNGFKQLALALNGCVERPHFEKISFRVNKRIFATLNQPENRACVKLSEIDQSVFHTASKGSIYPVPNKFGKQGWTLVNLNNTDDELITEVLNLSYNSITQKKK